MAWPGKKKMQSWPLPQTPWIRDSGGRIQQSVITNLSPCHTHPPRCWRTTKCEHQWFIFKPQLSCDLGLWPWKETLLNAGSPLCFLSLFSFSVLYLETERQDFWWHCCPTGQWYASLYFLQMPHIHKWYSWLSVGLRFRVLILWTGLPCKLVKRGAGPQNWGPLASECKTLQDLLCWAMGLHYNSKTTGKTSTCHSVMFVNVYNYTLYFLYFTELLWGPNEKWSWKYFENCRALHKCWFLLLSNTLEKFFCSSFSILCNSSLSREN